MAEEVLLYLVSWTSASAVDPLVSSRGVIPEVVSRDDISKLSSLSTKGPSLPGRKIIYGFSLAFLKRVRFFYLTFLRKFAVLKCFPNFKMLFIVRFQLKTLSFEAIL